MLTTFPEEITIAIREAKDRLPGAVLIVKHMLKQNRENCSVNKDAAMKIYRKQDGWYFHCFRCGYQGFVSDDYQSSEVLKDRWRRLQAKQTFESIERVNLPDDTIPMLSGSQMEVPSEAWHWFWKYHIHGQAISKYGIGWSDSYQRVIIPCRRTAVLEPSGSYAYDLLGWIGREVYCKDKEERKQKRVAKYLTKKSSHIKHLVFHAPTESKRIVLVEDVISAIKIAHMTGINAVALLTTYIPPKLMVKLKEFDITIWLDGDMLAKSVGYVQKYQQMGFKVGHIHTNQDPKAYTYNKLKKHLGLKED